MNKKTVETTIADKNVVEVLTGHVSGLRATEHSLDVDITDKKGRTHSFPLQGSSSTLMAFVAAACFSGKKIHVVKKPAGGLAEFRYGSKPRPAKEKNSKKPVKVKTPAEAAVEPVAGKPATA